MSVDRVCVLLLEGCTGKLCANSEEVELKRGPAFGRTAYAFVELCSASRARLTLSWFIAPYGLRYSVCGCTGQAGLGLRESPPLS